ncbi:MAG: SDR family oxidoreductase [Chitinophagales bacterium]|nr:SDR family oxidoreductase [Chitinophagales bacterium]
MNILVIGGSSGLGRSITEELASDTNNKVYFTYNQSIENAKALIDTYSNTQSIKVDFLNKAEVDRCTTLFAENDIQAIVFSAIGYLNKNYAHKVNSDSYLKGFVTNIIPLIQIANAGISYFRKQKFGRIITILSSGMFGSPAIGWSMYNAEKAYLYSLGKAWASENAGFGITSNFISPEFMQTQLTSDLDERLVEELLKQHPLKELLPTHEVAKCVHFLLKGPKHINGENIIISSGKVM